MLRTALLLTPLALLAACGSLLETTDSSGRHYATIKGTVSRSNGTPVANARIGVSCVGTTNEPFGLETESNASGAFETDLYGPSFFAPLTGPSYICRVLTPVTGVPQTEKSISVRVSPDFKTRPTTTVSLVVP
jgi:hypothetical protein